MTPSLAEFTPVVFHPVTLTQRITRLGFVGMGEAMQKKTWPVLHANGGLLDDIVVCSLEPHSCLSEPLHHYQQVRPDSLLPFDYLAEYGFLSHGTLWIISTPSEFHVQYAIQLAGLCRVALEKPLAVTSAQARLLLPYADRFEIYSMNHKVFNASVLAFVNECRQDLSLLRQVCHIEGTFSEAAGISRGRQQEDCIADVQWHLITCGLVAPFKAAATRFEVLVERAWVATHEPDPVGHYALPTVWTASRLQGRLLWDWEEVTFDFRQAKGAPTNEKVIRLFGGSGKLLTEIDLNETGWEAHARMLLALMRPVVDMRLTLADAVAVMELIDVSRSVAYQEPTYVFGTLPGFLA